MNKQAVVKIGGSVLSSLDGCESGFFDFKTATKLAKLLTENLEKGAFIIGGGKLNKWLLEHALANLPEIEINDQHYIGIAALNVNAEFFRIVLKHVLSNTSDSLLYDNIIRYADLRNKSFLQKVFNKYKYIVVGADKPGVSSDYDALEIARLLGAKRIISIKNVDKVYSDDPNKNKDAISFDSLSWDKYLEIIKQTVHIPRGNFPVDPVTARASQKYGMEFAIVGAKDFENIKNAITGKTFEGTLIH